MLWAFALLCGNVVAAPTVFKCNIDGTVSYQREPCPSGEPRRSPTVQQLNAERLKKKQQAAAAAASAPAPAVVQQAPAGFKCDGRTHCSQMKSCAEAKYFLAQCPGVQMDGNQDGIPCERQWCKR